MLTLFHMWDFGLTTSDMAPSVKLFARHLTKLFNVQGTSTTLLIGTALSETGTRKICVGEERNQTPNL